MRRVLGGRNVPLYFLGCKVVSLYGIGPVLDGMGLIHLVTTYCDDFTVSAVACRDMMPDIDFYMPCLRDTFGALSKSS